MATVPATTELAVVGGTQIEAYKIMKDQAKTFALSALLPDSIKGNSYDQAVANCLIATQMAQVMGEIPFVVMQNIHIVKGKAGFAAQYMIARANSSGIFKGRLNWRVDKSDPKNLSVTCYATLAETEEVVEFTVDMAMAEAEGWTSNKKYKTMPEVMLRYRSATFLIRFYAPDVMLGYRTVDEIEDISLIGKDADGEPLRAEHLIEQATPSAAEADDEQDSGEAVDAETGEIKTDPNTGMAEVDEETARKLDTGEESGDDGEGEQADEPEESPSEAKLREIRGGINAAKNLAYLKKIDESWINARAAYDDDVAKEIDGLITAKRKALSADKDGNA